MSLKQKPDNEARQAYLGLLAKAPAHVVATHWDALGLAPEFTWLRVPEIGTAMVRARAGGTGAPFNLGEMSVTRCALKLADGVVGHGYVQGRDKTHAQTAALIDALMQTEAQADVEAAVLEPIQSHLDHKAEARAAKAAATKVDFFTMVRGED